LVILGFYGRFNLGDEAYTCLPELRHLLKDMDVSFRAIDDMDKQTWCEVDKESDAYVVGGGDVINDYFANTLVPLVKPQKPWYALSVGMPYSSSLAKTLLVHLRHTFARSQSDADRATTGAGPKNVTRAADLCFLLADRVARLPPFQHLPIGVKKIGVCVARPFFANPEPLDALARALVAVVIDTAAEVHLIPFNTSDNEDESDLITNRALAASIKAAHPSARVVLHGDSAVEEPVSGALAVTAVRDPMNVLALLRKMDATVCVRYHSLVFSALCGTPYVAVGCTSKMDALATELLTEGSRRVRPTRVDAKNVPLELDTAGLEAGIRAAMHARSHKASEAETETRKRVCEMTERATQSVIRLREMIATHHQRTRYVDPLARALATAQPTLEKMHAFLEKTLPSLGCSSVPYAEGAPLGTVLQADEAREVAKLVFYGCTGGFSHPGVWGLTQKLETDPNVRLKDEADYVYKSFRGDTLELFELPDISAGLPPPVLRYLDRGTTQGPDFRVRIDPAVADRYEGVHRSGWAHALAGLLHLETSLTLNPVIATSTPTASDSEVWVDTYIDRTFGWGCNVLQAAGVVPYRHAWVGFVHHTFDAYNGDNSCAHMFEQEAFLLSLPTCKCLVALTHCLTSALRTELDKIGARHVQVHTLTHPTETNVKRFSIEAFTKNPRRALVQVGAWLREPYAIYRVQLPQWSIHNPWQLSKAELRGKNMERNFAPAGLIQNIEDSLFGPLDASLTPGDSASRARGQNLHSVGLVQALVNDHNSVTEIKALDDEAFDNLLAENIVFLCLRDCSAVNTVIECIVRGTPLVVNRLEPLEEILGKDYPGFYDKIEDVVFMLADKSMPEKMNTHLATKVDLSLFEISTFTRGLASVLCALPPPM
jgi:hypothetical protein